MKKGTKCRADACPQPFEIRKLFADRDVYELVANEDVSRKSFARNTSTRCASRP